MSRPGISGRHPRILRGLMASAAYVSLFVLLLPAAEDGLPLDSETPAPPVKEQQGWLEKQLQRFRSYPHLDRAYRLMKENRNHEARSEMEMYLTINPADRAARMNYLLLLFQLKDYSSVVREAGRMIEEKQEGMLYLYRAIAREKMKEMAEALEDYRRAASATGMKAEDRIFALEEVVDLAISLKKPSAALDALKSLGESASPYGLHLRRGMALELDNQLRAAAEAFHRAAETAKTPQEAAGAFEFEGEVYKKTREWKPAHAALERALTIDPQKLSLLRSLGEVAYNEKRYTESTRYTRQALALQENDADRARLVYSLRESGNLAQAEVELAPLILRAGDDPTILPLYLLKGDLALAQQKQGEAQSAFERVLRYDPSSALALRSLAKISRDRKKFTESIRWVERIRPSDRLPQDLELLGELYLGDGRPELAVKLYRDLLQSGYRRDSRYVLLMQLGEAYKAAGHPDDAAGAFGGAARLRADITTVEALVQSLLLSGKTAQAVEEVDRLAQSRLSAEDRAKLALLYVKTGEEQRALAQLSLALGGPLPPAQERQARTQRGFIYRRMGRLREAKEDFEAAAKSGADNDALFIALGETCLVLNEFEKAKIYLKETRTPRGEAEARPLLAQAYEGAGDLTEALSLYEKLLLENAVYSEKALACLLSIGNLETKLGRPAAAAEHFLQAYERSGAKDWKLLFQALQNQVVAGQWEAANSTSERILSLQSLPRESAAIVWEQLADVSLQMNNMERAARCFENAIACGRDDWRIQQRLGLVFYNLGQREKALDRFLASLQRKETARTMVYASRCYKDLGKPESALRLLNQAMVDPNGLTDTELCEIQREAGYLHFNASDFDAAAKAWESAIRCQPDPVLAVRLSRAMRLAGHPAEAEKWLPALPPPEATATLQAEYFDELAVQLEAGSRTREAIQALLKALQLEPQPPRAYQLGLLYREINDPGQATVYLSRAVTEDASNAEYRSALGYVLLAEKRYAEAAAQFEAALKITPDNPTLYKDLGYIYAHLARNGDASGSFLKALDIESSRRGGYPKDDTATRREAGILRGEVSKLNNRIDLTIYLAQSSDKRSLPPVPPALALSAIPSYAGAELNFTPPKIGLRNERLFQLFARVLGSLEPGTLRPDPDTYQAGIGLRYKPMGTQNLFISAERILGLRNSAANNWLLRGLYSKDWGYDLKPGYRRWNYTILYGDLGLYAKSPQLLIGYGEIRQGVSFNLRDVLVITPHMIADGRFYRLQESANPYIEAGGGVSFKYFLNHGEHRLRRATFELLLHYRTGRMFESGLPAQDTKMTFGGFAGTGIVSF